MSQIYTLSGEIKEFPYLISGKPFFRKMTDTLIEQKIYEILRHNPHPNIVISYDITNRYCDIEMVNPNIDIDTYNEIIISLKNAKKHLQKLGIIYIDWKIDNIGISEDGKYKLYDFDASGIIDLKTKKWIVKPLQYFYYRKAIEKDIEEPNEIDNFSFSEMLSNLVY